MPAQFFAAAGASPALWTGARRLLFAVLQDAVHTLLATRGMRTAREQRLFREVQEWFASTDQRWLYAFERICQYLSLDPEAFRRGLRRRLQAQGDSRPRRGPLRPGGAARPAAPRALAHAA